MNDLAVGLDLVRAGAKSYTSLKATHRLWRDREVETEHSRLLNEARRAQKGWVPSPWITEGGDRPSAEPRSSELRTRLWVSRPSKVRVEHGKFVTVIDGDRWWEAGGGFGPVTGQDQSMVRIKLELDRVAFMLDPSFFAGAHGLSFAGTDTVGGRAAIRLKSPEPSDPAALLYPGRGAARFLPEFELWVDAERGLLLLAAERFRGRDLEVVELLDVEFDIRIPDEVFTMSLPAGGEFRRWEDISPRNLSLEEAVRSVSFTVLVPQDVPREAGSWDGKVLFEPRSGWLGFGYIDRNQIPPVRVDITERASWAPDEVDLSGYQSVECEGRALFVRSADSRDGTWHSIRLDREGTKVSIDSMLDRDTSIAVATSLRTITATT